MLHHKLSIMLSWLWSISLLLTACQSSPTRKTDDTAATPTVAWVSEEERAYLDSFIFLGESTTYHLKSRGVLSGGCDTTQVWAPPSGTLKLDATVETLEILYPETGELLPFSQALARKKPERILFCFGLNGAVTNIRRGSEYFKSCYLQLIQTVKENTPETQIILQSAYPVADNMDMSAYTVDRATLNRYIDQINGWTRQLAAENGLLYLDTASVLKDEQGDLRLEYQNGDGYHLTADAYRLILQYIASHPEGGIS